MLEVDGRTLTLEAVEAVANGASARLAAAARVKVQKARELVEVVMREQRPVYAVSTGVGDLCTQVISASDAQTLQRNIVRSHAAGVGPPLAEPVVRELLRDYGEIRYVWRHLPLTDVHPPAQLAAEATEAEAKQGDILCTLVTDKAVYGVEDPVDLTLTVTNTGKGAVKFNFPTNQQYDFVIRRGETQVAKWSLGQTFSQSGIDLILASGKSFTFNTRWLQKDQDNQFVPLSQTLVLDFKLTQTAAQLGTSSRSLGRIALRHIATIFPGVSRPSRVVRSIIEIAIFSPATFDDFLIERFARDQEALQGCGGSCGASRVLRGFQVRSRNGRRGSCRVPASKAIPREGFSRPGGEWTRPRPVLVRFS